MDVLSHFDDSKVFHKPPCAKSIEANCSVLALMASVRQGEVLAALAGIQLLHALLAVWWANTV